MKKTSQLIEFTPVKREVLSPAEFLRLSKDRPHSIARSRFVAPKFGSKGFGGFEVEYDVPQLRQSHATA